MATVNPTINTLDAKYGVVTWETLTADDVGAAVSEAKFSDKSVQIMGTLGGATVTLQGSMDNVTWVTLTKNGTDEISGAGMFLVFENPRYIRPKVTGGDGTTDVDVILGFSTLN